MNDTATQQERELDLGAEESTAQNNIWVNLRIGTIAQTSNTQLDGFVPAQTKNKDGSINNFFAKPYKKITGFIREIWWHSHGLPDGTVLTGWQIAIDTTKEIFVLKIASNDRPFERTMNCLIGLDFDKPVMFVGFMGTNKKTNHPQKILLMSQGLGPDNKPLWAQPAYEEKWMSRLLYKKLRDGIELTDEERKNVSYMNDGTWNNDYPYITERADGKWSLEKWTDFLIDIMREQVIPEARAAAERRGNTAPPAIVPDEDIAEELLSQVSPAADDDDIPF